MVPPDEPVRVAVLSDYALVRAGLTTMLRAGTGHATVVDTGEAEVVLYDLAGRAAHDSRRDLGRLTGTAAVVGLVRAGRPDLEDGARALGVRHVVCEDVDPETLLRTLRLAVTEGTAAHDDCGLSSRERTVLVLVGGGLSNQEVADRMFVSVNTVKTYVRTAYRKIGVHSRSQAVLWTMRHGLASEGEVAASPAGMVSVGAPAVTGPR
ncbi:response regulator transcription factor [Nocardioides anomalus]|uniref:Response regulator transcription factor n=1 Tax=Nocardioides anomalus TaxID=2712223 RepID=A0A6G6WDT7_9ACTN|nr:response regulator transcription factor [Nocardioides anomalus]QIG43394.1 response regulator transcription factor [Nocardioides anomalus]